MFCKNCGREIDQKTLEKLMRPSGEHAACPNCGQEVDTAEFCGGFWGLVASGRVLQGGSDEETEPGTAPDARGAGRKAGGPDEKQDQAGQRIEDRTRCGTRIPGVTEADRMLARMILEDDDDGTERSGRGAAGTGVFPADSAAGSASGEIHTDQDFSAGRDIGKKRARAEKTGDSGSGRIGSGAGGSDKKAGASDKKAGASGKKAGASAKGTSLGGLRPAAAAILAAAVLVGFLAGRFLPFSSGGGNTGAAGTEQTASGQGSQGTDAQTTGNLKGEDAGAQADSLARADDRDAASQEGEDILSGREKEGAGNTPNVEDGTDGGQGGSSPENTSAPVGTEGGGYNMIRRTLTEVNDLMIEDSVLYYGTQDSGITFDGEKLRNEWLSGAGGVSYVMNGIEESDGTLRELDRIYYDKNGDEINNSSGYSRVKFEYDDQGALEKKKYYAMVRGREKDTKICTSECRIRESGEESISVEIFKPSEDAADNETFRYRKTERTFMSQDSDLPGALSTVRYYLDESDPEPEREEVHEYSRVDVPASGEETEEYGYCVEETIRIFVRKGNGEADSRRNALSAAGESTAESVETAASGATSEPAGSGESSESAEMAASGITSEAAGSEAAGSEAAGSGESSGPAETAASAGTWEEGDSENSAEAGGSVMTDLITVRYYFEEDDDQPRLVRMGFYQDGSPAEGKAGFSGFTRSYKAGQTVWEDLFFGTEGMTENEDTESAALPDSRDAESAADPDSGDAELTALLGVEEPLLAGEAVPGYYSAENPWLFLIP